MWPFYSVVTRMRRWPRYPGTIRSLSDLDAAKQVLDVSTRRGVSIQDARGLGPDHSQIGPWSGGTRRRRAWTYVSKTCCFNKVQGE